VADRVLGLENLILLGLTYPVVKLCHELGHAYAVKRGGGEVHELGLMFLVFAPVPYVDASASTVFRSKWQRMGVAAAGMLVELFLAALALFVWLAAEPGITRSIAYNVMLIGGASTLLFNGNPLVRCDGYYLLSDALEIPNLSRRSAEYLLARSALSPAPAPGEAVWLALYAPASWLYRLSLMLAVAWFVASRYFFAGAVLALWSVWSVMAWPLLRQLFAAAADAPERRALRLVYGLGAAAVLAGVLVAAPCWTNAEGVVWVPQNAEVRAGTAGFVTRLLANPGHAVIEGEPLLELGDADLAADREVREAKVAQLQVRLATEMFDDRLKAELTRQSLAAEQAGVERTLRRVAGLECVAGRAGRWVVANAGDLPGRYFAQGALVGYVLSGSLRTVRVVIPQEEADLVRAHTRRVELHLADRPGETLHAKAVREVPGGSERLPSKALALAGGGPFATDPRDSSELKTLARTFQFDLELEENVSDLTFGTRAYVRFEHPGSPLVFQLWRRVRQLFLSRLSV
jgi:putative peptide zinc metalloprotease protein